jgi:hypothetical protein
MARDCGQCLMMPNRVVPGKRAAAILKDCRRRDVSFECHKGSLADRHIACRNHFDTGVGQFSRVCERLGLLRWVDPDTLEEAEAPERYRPKE